jgi:hypothetical protein
VTTTQLHPDDPLQQPRRLQKRWTAIAALAAPLLIWALWPAKPASLPPAPAAPIATDHASSATRPPLRLAAFDAPIWTLDPPPPTPATPPPPLRLQLVGIIRDEGGAKGAKGTLKAVIYDPDTDELVVVAEGAKIGPRSITRIDAAGVTLTDAAGAGNRRLLLDPQAPQ